MFQKDRGTEGTWLLAQCQSGCGRLLRLQGLKTLTHADRCAPTGSVTNPACGGALALGSQSPMQAALEHLANGWHHRSASGASTATPALRKLLNSHTQGLSSSSPPAHMPLGVARGQGQLSGEQ